ncbi:structural maintenance of chromosomes protein 4-like [Magnolia sinica]|uniref:structural maintenance of chromosomes protein 4-like n=1 Tax=Magnolia sinica TaxID=86752 RepID=UPI0026585B7F|nr:structural maintenance of chromosomes protein 4-like [Magnolia sinica]
MIVACHHEGRGRKFWGRSIQLDPVGFLTLEFDDGEVFQWSKDDGIYEAVAGSDFIITRVAFRDNSSKYYINDRGSNFIEVTKKLKGKGVDFDNCNFSIIVIVIVNE